MEEGGKVRQRDHEREGEDKRRMESGRYGGIAMRTVLLKYGQHTLAWMSCRRHAPYQTLAPDIIQHQHVPAYTSH